MKLKLLFILLFLTLFITNVSAQVTIGSGHKPQSGALLDLKEESTLGQNSTKGLLLPRMSLTSRSTLSDIANGTVDQQTAIHTGLMVYNLSERAPFCKGVYVWASSNWRKLGSPCRAFLSGLKDIDFGVSAGDIRQIVFKTNGKWQYTVDANYTNVLANASLAANTPHAGGSLEEEEKTVQFDITSADHTPNAGTVYNTQFTFETLEHPSGEEAKQSINIRRVVPSYFNILSATSGNIARTTPTIHAKAESNDLWSMLTYINNVPHSTDTQPNAPLNTKEFSKVIPTNDSWDARAVRMEVVSTNSITGIPSTATYPHTQLPWSLYYEADNVDGTIPRLGGNYVVRLNGDFPGPVSMNVNGGSLAHRVRKPAIDMMQ